MKHLMRLVAGFGLALVASAPLCAADVANLLLKGRVTNDQGQPIAGATVEAYRHDLHGRFASDDPTLLQRVNSDASGAVEFPVPRATLLLLARRDGWAPAWRQISAKPGAEAGLRMTAPSVLAGKVVDEADRPVANAEVYATVVINEEVMEGSRRSYHYLMGKLARECFSASTAADGRFRLTGFPTNAATDLAIKAPGKVLRQTPRESLGPDTMQARAGQEDLRLVAEPGGSIEGKILTVTAGESLPEAQLFLQPEGPGLFGVAAGEPAASAPDGTFRIPDLAAGSYRIRAVFGTNAVPDWVADSVTVSVESGQPTRGVELTATRGGLLEVAVLGKEDRQVLGGVQVGAYRQSLQVGAITGTNGLALFRLPPGDYQLGAAREGWIADNTTARVETGKTNRAEIEMSPPPTLRGIVRRPDGQPAAGLAVQIVGSFAGDDSQTKTDASGRFEMEWNPQRYGQSDVTFCLLIRDPERNLAVAKDIDEDTESLELTLESALTLAGRAECAGQPLTNASATLVFWTGNRGIHLSDFSTQTNAPGQFEIPALPVDRGYGLYVTASGYGQQYVDAREFQDEAGRIELDPVELRPANLKLAGQVLDTEDKPVGGAYVNLSGEGQPNAGTRTDREGRFSFDQVCEGAVRLFANAQSTHGNVMAEAGDTNVVLRLGETYNMSSDSAPRKLSGVVSDPDGKPVAGAQVSVFPDGSSRWVKTDAQGAFKLTWSVQPWQLQSGGDPCLVVRDLAHNLAAVEDLLEDVTNLNVQLAPALTLTGRVENIAGEPLAGAQVGLWLLACNTYSQISDQLTPADANGGFEIRTLPVGPQYIVYASAKDHGRSQRNLEVDAETNRLELEPFALKRANQVIEGQVVNEAEKPLAGVNVSLSGDDQPQDSDTTDRQGRFRFEVCEGTVRLFASSQSGYADATAAAGDTNVIIQLTSSRSFSERTVRRASLKGRPLPDLSPLGLEAGAVPAGKPVLLCLVDVEQRPSRRVARLLAERQEMLGQKGVTLVLVQSTVIPPESLQSWQTDTAVKCPVGRVPEAANAKWAASVETLPWLILSDAKGNVAAEGFSLEELDAHLDALAR